MGQQASNSYEGRKQRQRQGGPQQATVSLKAGGQESGRRPTTRDWPSGCWFLKGPVLSGKVAIPLPRGTHSDHNANYGWNGRAGQGYSRAGRKEIQLKKKKKPKSLRVPACLVERQADYEQMF